MTIRSSAVLLFLCSSNQCHARLIPNFADRRAANGAASDGSGLRQTGVAARVPTSMGSQKLSNDFDINDGANVNLVAVVPALMATSHESDTTAVNWDQARVLVDDEEVVQGLVGAGVMDTPIKLDGSFPQDLDPPRDAFLSRLQEDIVDTPNGVDEVSEAEIPAMEPIPQEYTVGQPDIVDEISQDSSSEFSEAEIPAMEPIPSEYSASQLDIVDESLQAELPAMEPIPSDRAVPLALAYNKAAEATLLNETSSVCAGSLVEAQFNCVELPMCKFSVRESEVTNELLPDQGECSRRCDASILGDHHCAPNQECFHFIFGCACVKLTSDGGKCQPF